MLDAAVALKLLPSEKLPSFRELLLSDMLLPPDELLSFRELLLLSDMLCCRLNSCCHFASCCCYLTSGCSLNRCCHFASCCRRPSCSLTSYLTAAT